jgi:hypothetical protein
LATGLQPVPGSGIQGVEVVDLKTREEVLFDVAHAVFHPAFLVAFAHMARGNGQATVGGNVDILGIEPRRFPPGALEDGGCEAIDHDFCRNAAEARKGVLMAGQAVLHGLGDGALDRQHAAIAQDHDKEAQSSLRLPHRDEAERAPVHLGTLAGGTGEREKGGLPPGSHRSHIGLHERIAAIKAVGAEVLEHLGGGIGIALPHAPNLCCERIECAGARGGFSWSAMLLGQPRGHGAGIERQCVGALRGLKPLVRLKVFDLAEAVIIDHDRVSVMRLNISLRAMGVLAAASLGV